MTIRRKGYENKFYLFREQWQIQGNERMHSLTILFLLILSVLYVFDFVPEIEFCFEHWTSKKLISQKTFLGETVAWRKTNEREIIVATDRGRT